MSRCASEREIVRDVIQDRLNIITARDKPFRCVEVLFQPCSGVGRKPRSTITMSTSCRQSCSIWLRVLFLHDTGVGAACICSGALLVSGSTWSAQKAWTTRKSTTIVLASSVGLNGMKVDTSSLKWIASSSLCSTRSCVAKKSGTMQCRERLGASQVPTCLVATSVSPATAAITV